VKHILVTLLNLHYYYKFGFGDPKMSTFDQKVGRKLPVEKHCCKYVSHNMKSYNSKGISEKVREKVSIFGTSQI